MPRLACDYARMNVGTEAQAKDGGCSSGSANDLVKSNGGITAGGDGYR